MTEASSATPPANYPDIHCWVFTPSSFAGLMRDLAALKLMPFACEAVFETEPYTFEFFVRMKASDDQEQILESWRRAAAAPQQYGAPSLVSRWNMNAVRAARKVLGR